MYVYLEHLLRHIVFVSVFIAQIPLFPIRDDSLRLTRNIGCIDQQAETTNLLFI